MFGFVFFSEESLTNLILRMHLRASLWRTLRGDGTESRFFSDWLARSKNGERRWTPAVEGSAEDGNNKVCRTKTVLFMIRQAYNQVCMWSGAIFIFCLSIWHYMHIILTYMFIFTCKILYLCYPNIPTCSFFTLYLQLSSIALLTKCNIWRACISACAFPSSL